MKEIRFINGFLKNICIFLGASWPYFGLKVANPCYLIWSKDFLKTFYKGNEWGQEVHKNDINGFSDKSHIWDKWETLGTKMVQPYNSGSTPRTFSKFCIMKVSKRYINSFSEIFFAANRSFWAASS